mmetsp:Transcript_29481/g.77960  ORF Transcript_29481/g.77960 Transcript_29481/m.77960 type:complete len:307 (+) Transcript_29481:543-1463(+)
MFIVASWWEGVSVPLAFQLVQRCDDQPSALILQLRQGRMVPSILGELVAHHFQSFLQLLHIFPGFLCLLFQSLPLRCVETVLRLLGTHPLLLGCICLAHVSLMHLFDQFLIHVGAPCQLHLQILVDFEMQTQLVVVLNQGFVLVIELLCRFALEMKLCRHLFVLHDDALRCGGHLVFRSCPQHLFGFLEVSLHIRLQLLYLHRLLAIKRANVLIVFLCLIKELLLQGSEFGLNSFLVLPKLIELVQRGGQTLVLHGELIDLVIPRQTFLLQLVPRLLLQFLRVFLQLLILFFEIFDFAEVFFQIGM